MASISNHMVIAQASDVGFSAETVFRYSVSSSLKEVIGGW